MQYIKKAIYWTLRTVFAVYNPRSWQDKNGVVVTDMKRKTHSILLKRKIKKGKVSIPKREGEKRCYKVKKDGKLVVATLKKSEK